MSDGIRTAFGAVAVASNTAVSTTNFFKVSLVLSGASRTGETFSRQGGDRIHRTEDTDRKEVRSSKTRSIDIRSLSVSFAYT
jgi:hypothetical protein